MADGIRTTIYQVNGMHCRSCELLIETEVSRLKGVHSVTVSASEGIIEIESDPGREPSVSALNRLFKKSGYAFNAAKSNPNSSKITPIQIFLTAVILSVTFFIINRLGIFSSIRVTSQTFPPAFFVFGLLAGFSTCAALTGGLLLTLQNQWGKNLFPTLLFNSGRLLFFTLMGGLLGLLGSSFQFSLSAAAVFSIFFSLFVIGLALQMMGFKFFNHFQLALSKSFTQKIISQSGSTAKLMPLFLGALTFFLPCGFTLTAQSLALASGNFAIGAQILFFFSLGTFPPLFFIGYLGAKFSQKSSVSSYLTAFAGILVLFFALININSQLNLLGLNPFSQAPSATSDFPPIINGQQILKMNASASGYFPSSLKVKAGIPVRWEITDTGTSGCTGAIISRSLFDDRINLVPGTTSIKVFNPPSPGTYRFSCWMGMITGFITVVD